MPAHVSNNQDPESLKVVSRVYGEEVEKRRMAGQDVESAKLVRDIAAFKAQALYFAKKRHRVLEDRRGSGRKNSFLLSGSYLDKEDFEIIEKTTAFDNDSSISLDIDKRAKERKACYVVRMASWVPLITLVLFLRQPGMETLRQ